MSRSQFKLTIGLFAVLLAALAVMVHADPLGSIVTPSATYTVDTDLHGKGMLAKFGLAGDTLALYPGKGSVNLFTYHKISYRADMKASKWVAKVGYDLAIPIVVVTDEQPATVPVVVIIPPVEVPATLPIPPPVVDVPATLQGRPSADTTGITPGVALKPGAGVKIVAGGNYSGLWLGSQSLNLAKGQTITFTDCRLDAGSGPWAVRCENNAGLITFTHCELQNFDSAAIWGANFQAIGCYVHGSNGDGFKPTHDALIQGNYVTNLGLGDGAHADGVQMIGGYNVRVVGNFFDQARDRHCNRNLMAQHDGLANIEWVGNWQSGSGDFAIQCFNSTSPATIQFKTNVFIRSKKYTPRHVQDGVIWLGNVFDDGTAAN